MATQTMIGSDASLEIRVNPHEDGFFARISIDMTNLSMNISHQIDSIDDIDDVTACICKAMEMSLKMSSHLEVGARHYALVFSAIYGAVSSQQSS